METKNITDLPKTLEMAPFAFDKSTPLVSDSATVGSRGQDNRIVDKVYFKGVAGWRVVSGCGSSGLSSIDLESSYGFEEIDVLEENNEWVKINKDSLPDTSKKPALVRVAFGGPSSIVDHLNHTIQAVVRTQEGKVYVLESQFNGKTGGGVGLRYSMYDVTVDPGYKAWAEKNEKL